MSNELVIKPPQAKCVECYRRVAGRKICSDCDYMSNPLLREVTSKLKTMEDKIKNSVHDQARVEIWKNNHDNLLKEEEKVKQAFDEAMKVLTERKGEILRQMENSARIQKLVIDGQFSAHCRNELSKCDTNGSLDKLKDFLSVPNFDQTLSSLDTGVRFQYDMADVSKFGNIVFGDVEPAIQSTVPDVRPKVLTNPMAIEKPGTQKQHVLSNFMERATQTGRPFFDPAMKTLPKSKIWQLNCIKDIVNPLGARNPVLASEEGIENNPRAASVEYASVDNPPHAVKALEPTDPQELLKFVRGRQAPLTAEVLAGFQPDDQKRILGEYLYLEVRALCPDKAGKITGMFLELDNDELLYMLKVRSHIKCKVNQAIAVLKEHEANEAAHNHSDQYQHGSRRHSSSSDDNAEDWGSPKWW